MADVSPLDWLNRLYPLLMKRSSALAPFDAYYSGEHPLPFLSRAHQDKIRSEFRQMLNDSRTNFMRLIVDAVEERLQVEGFRLSASSDLQTDRDAWDIWQANQLDALTRAAFTETLVKGVSYLSVWQDVDGDGYPDIAIEDPCETIIAYTPGTNFRRRDAALKVWTDQWTGMRRANVFLPDGLYKFEADPEKTADNLAKWTSTGGDGDGTSTKWRPLAGDDAVVDNPIGIVPIVPLRNRPRLLCEGESELADSFRIQNQVNSFLFLLALGGYFGAHRQRWATGITLMEDEETGQVKEPFDVAIDKLWTSENPETSFGDFAQTDLSGYIRSIEQKIEHLAITTRTPKHYLLPTGQEPSGDAIKASESGLVKKVERKQATLGEGLEEMLRLARLFSGEDDQPVDSEVVWAAADTPNEAARTDSVIKQYAEGLLPAETALEKLGYSQTEIARIMSQRASDKLLAAVLNPAPPEQAAPPATPEPPAVG